MHSCSRCVPIPGLADGSASSNPPLIASYCHCTARFRSNSWSQSLRYFHCSTSARQDLTCCGPSPFQVQFNGLTPLGTNLNKKVIQPFLGAGVNGHNLAKPILVRAPLHARCTMHILFCSGQAVLCNGMPGISYRLYTVGRILLTTLSSCQEVGAHSYN